MIEQKTNAVLSVLQRPGMIYVLALVAGLLYPLGFSPVDFWPATLFSMSVFYGLLSHADPKTGIRRWKIAACYGFMQFALGTSWVYVSIHDFGGANVFLAFVITLLFTFYLTLYPILIGWLMDRIHLSFHSRPFYFALWFVFLWLLSDGLRGWIFSGFPWLFAGYSGINLPLTGFAPIIGIDGMTLLMLIISISLFHLVRDQKKWLPLVVSFAIVLLGYGLQQISWSTPQGKVRSVTLVQPNISQSLKWEPNHLRNSLHTLDELTYLSKGDLIIWPESAIPVFANRIYPYLQTIARRSASKGQKILTGAPVSDPDNDNYYAAAMLLDADHIEASQSYYKRRLVPFGEYVPLQSTLRGLIQFFDLPMSGFSLGPDNQKTIKWQDISLGMAICYEIAYPNLVYDQSKNSNAIVTISNDAWFGHSLGPWQHLEMARMRALETQLPVLRATNNGITAMIDAKGQVTQQLPQFKKDKLESSFQPAKSHAPIQYYPFYKILMGVLLMLLWVFRNK